MVYIVAIFFMLTKMFNGFECKNKHEINDEYLITLLTYVMVIETVRIDIDKFI